jgi:hypothetical protein
MNPTLPFDGEFIQARYRENENWARAEFGAEWRGDLEGYIGLDALRACVKPGVTERPPERRHKYFAHTDPSGGVNNSMTLAICHKDGETVVVDAIREAVPPFSPECTVEEFADLLRRYRVKRITSDRYGGEWVREQFRKRGVLCLPAERNTSQYFIDFLPQLTEGAVDLLDHERMLAQFAALERSPRRGTHDAVSHPKNGHDDIAAAVASACVQAMARCSGGQIYEREQPRSVFVAGMSGTYFT